MKMPALLWFQLNLLDQPVFPLQIMAATAQPTKLEVCQSVEAHDASDFFQGKPVIDLRRAAVLIPLFFKDDQIYVLLTMRSKKLRTHGGEVAFPGGKKDEEDKDIVATALREAEEEIGLPQDQVEVVAQLPPSISKEGLVVTPVVGFIRADFVPKPNPEEVSYAFSAPLVDFASSEKHTANNMNFQGRSFIMHFFAHQQPFKPHKEILTWGLTAYMAIIVACIVYNRPPDFEVDSGFDWQNPTKAAEGTFSRYCQRNGISYDGGYEQQSKIWWILLYILQNRFNQCSTVWNEVNIL